jgi:hypothetical protein
MDFEKTLISNFKTRRKYAIYLGDYYMPIFSIICTILDSRNKEQGTNDRRMDAFRWTEIITSIFNAPAALSYSDFNKIALNVASKQIDEIYKEPEWRSTAIRGLEICRLIFEAIEHLPGEQRAVVKILLTPRHADLVRKFLRFTDIVGLQESATQTLRKTLPYESFRYFNLWIQNAAEIV